MSNKKFIPIWIVGVVAIVAAVVLFSKKENEIESTDGGGAFDIPFNKQGELVFIDSISSDTLSIIDIEVADNDQKRARGLMYRKTIPENAGMLFVHNTEEFQSFWMKNTYISLDMIFANADKRIVTIHANTTRLKEWSYASTKPAIYVVEVNAGFCLRNNVKIGDKIDFVVKANS